MRFSRKLFLLLVATLFAYGLLSISHLARFGTFNSLIGFGCIPEICFSNLNASILPENAHVYQSGGYDGQFYYYIAASIHDGVRYHIDSVPFRYARIGFPLLLQGPIWLSEFMGDTHLKEWLSVVTTLFLLFTHLLLVTCICIAGRGELPKQLLSPCVWVGGLSSDNRESRAFRAATLFAINPFSLLSFALSLPDGMALGFCILAWSIFEFRIRPALDANWSRKFTSDSSMNRLYSNTLHTFIVVLFAVAFLTKETMGIIPLGIAFYFILVRRDIQSFGFYLACLIPAIYWWTVVGFSPFLAGQRGTLPFVGLIEYLHQADSIVSGRSLLLLWFGFCVLRAGQLFWNRRFTIPFFVYGASLALFSMATSHEYWANFANISRLFATSVFALSFDEIRAQRVGLLILGIFSLGWLVNEVF